MISPLPPTLAERLVEAAPRLTLRVLDEMYANPFWHARFGERGRVHSGKDGLYHVTYLNEALAAGDHRVFVEYARWLRELLTSRGMCSRHLAENFERLAAAIAEEGWPDGGRAVAVLEAGAAALAYRDGAAGLLDAHRDELVAHAGAALDRDHSEALAAGDHAGRARRTDDLGYHLSYLADALAADRAEGFPAHALDLARLRAGASQPAHALAAELHALADALATVPALSGQPAALLLAAAGAVGNAEAPR